MSIELDIHKWLQELEMTLCKPLGREIYLEENVECIFLPTIKVDIEGWVQDTEKVIGNR